MLKVSYPVLGSKLLTIFNTIFSNSIVPSIWKDNILTLLHKSGSVSDPDNYRGIAVGSCISKLFSELLNQCLQVKVKVDNLVGEQQGSGKKGSRTADHLLVVKFFIDKYVNIQGGKLFACFVDLKKCYDKIPRSLLFYNTRRYSPLHGLYF